MTNSHLHPALDPNAGVYPVREVIDLTDPAANTVFDTSVEQIRKLVASGDRQGIAKVDGQFAILGKEDHIVRMARTLAVPLRYFIAKREDGPSLIAANRIEQIEKYLNDNGMADQFHPSYTRMVPAHYLTEVALLGCPDPNPIYTRFFEPKRNALPGDISAIGDAYIQETSRHMARWLDEIDQVDDRAPIGISFSGGIDSGAIFLIAWHLFKQTGRNPGRLKAFTLSLDSHGDDARQAREFVESMDLSVFHEVIERPTDSLDLENAVALMEDYKPLDIQSGAMAWSLLFGIRERYPDWQYLLDGDGGDENLKDYPIEENPELTIKSVLNNPLLYHEGWGVDSIKHSLTFTGGLSRGCTRSFAPAKKLGFKTFSPFMLPDVIAVSEGIPFIELTNWDHQRLYALKGQVVSEGIKSLTGLSMPVFEKRRFQHGAISADRLHQRLPDSQDLYRRAFNKVFNG